MKIQWVDRVNVIAISVTFKSKIFTWLCIIKVVYPNSSFNGTNLQQKSIWLSETEGQTCGDQNANRRMDPSIELNVHAPKAGFAITYSLHSMLIESFFCCEKFHDIESFLFLAKSNIRSYFFLSLSLLLYSLSSIHLTHHS